MAKTTTKVKKRIILTGAQGTGKTTLMNVLAADGTKTLSIARDTAIEFGWPVSDDKVEEYQKTLFDELYNAVSSNDNFVSDRGLTCIAAYTFSDAIDGKISKKTADNQYLTLQKFHADNPDILIVYVPIEFDIEDDGLRSTSKQEQAKIDYLIKNLLDTAGVKYITVTGSVEERVAQVENALVTI